MLASGLAGFMDAAVGGGGLITVPALMLGLPAGTPMPVLFGTNKVVACTGTSVAAAKFLRSGILDWREMLLPVLFAAGGSVAGSWFTYQVRPDFLRPVVLVLLGGVLVFTLLKPDMGHLHAPRFGLAHQRALASLIALVVGAYDGFFGPGTGTFLIYLFVVVLGFDFMRASALAKSANWASNAASLTFFLAHGSWIWAVALPMALANGVGGYLGARTVLGRGSSFVRGLFLVVVSALVLRLGWQVLQGLFAASPGS
ncbi:MAG: TSUP family transporter [Acidobacteria bacterium]|nr:TSUP family transporter [Acidobacteriota bacterium]